MYHHDKSDTTNITYANTTTTTTTTTANNNEHATTTTSTPSHAHLPGELYYNVMDTIIL